jgi:2-dehydro-3-deoxyphosphooctonate aldolase (KDO 8-P synthase)
MIVIMGPCVIEGYRSAFLIAQELKNITKCLELQFIFKASYDKANRSSISSYRGPGITEGLKILSNIKKELDIEIMSDVHSPEEAEIAGEVLDYIQIPAFLCRQTDLLVAAAKTGKPLNIKKGQFMPPRAMGDVLEKLSVSGNNHRTLLTERGTTFGYNDLVVDFRNIQIMQEGGARVIIDATHPSGGSGFVEVLARAGIAAGADGIFAEVHSRPEQAKCDGHCSLKLTNVYSVLKRLKKIEQAVKNSIWENEEV